MKQRLEDRLVIDRSVTNNATAIPFSRELVMERFRRAFEERHREGGNTGFELRVRAVYGALMHLDAGRMKEAEAAMAEYPH